MVRLITLVVLAALIAASSFVGQLAFRMDRTFLRHDFVQRELGTWLEPLAIQRNHQRFTTSLVNEIRRSLGWSVPGQVLVAINEAAVQTFTPEWIESFARRTHTAAYRLMRGDRTPVRLSVPLGELTSRVQSRVNDLVPAQQARVIAGELAGVPESIDLWQGLDERAQERVTTFLSRIPVYSVILQYALPGVLLALTLVFRRPGSAMIASGGGLAGGAAVMIVFVTSSAEAAARFVGRTVRGALPGQADWIEEPIAASVTRAVQSGIAFAALLATIGLVLIITGGLVVRFWGDRLDPLVGSARSLLRDS